MRCSSNQVDNYQYCGDIHSKYANYGETNFQYILMDFDNYQTTFPYYYYGDGIPNTPLITSQGYIYYGSDQCTLGYQNCNADYWYEYNTSDMGSFYFNCDSYPYFEGYLPETILNNISLSNAVASTDGYIWDESCAIPIAENFSQLQPIGLEDYPNYPNYQNYQGGGLDTNLNYNIASMSTCMALNPCPFLSNLQAVETENPQNENFMNENGSDLLRSSFNYPEKYPMTNSINGYENRANLQDFKSVDFASSLELRECGNVFAFEQNVGYNYGYIGNGYNSFISNEHYTNYSHTQMFASALQAQPSLFSRDTSPTEDLSKNSNEFYSINKFPSHQLS